MSDVGIKEDVVTHETTDDGDHEKFAHVVVPASAVTEAYITGTPVTALCGKTWVPTRDPGRYQVCPTCQEILDAARAFKAGGGGSGGEGGGKRPFGFGRGKG